MQEVFTTPTRNFSMRFNSKRFLPVNSAYIINLQKSELPGSHWISVIIQNKFIIYMDSVGLPLINEYILTKLKSFKKPIYYSSTDIQGTSMY